MGSAVSNDFKQVFQWELELLRELEQGTAGAHFRRVLEAFPPQEDKTKYLQKTHFVGDSPVHLAVASGHDVLRQILAFGFSPDATLLRCHGRWRLPGQTTPLYEAIKAKDAIAVNILLEHGADPSLRPQRERKTPLDLAREIHNSDPLGRSQMMSIIRAIRTSATEQGAMSMAPSAPRESAANPDVPSQNRNEHVEEGNLSEFMTEHELALNTAIELQERASKTEAILRECHASKESLLTKLKEVNTRIQFHQDELCAIKESYGFKDQAEIEVLLQTNATRRRQTRPHSHPRDAHELACPVCLERPKEIFCCAECHNMVCGKCRPRLTSCPLCRANFLSKPPMRNRYAERILRDS